MGKLKVIKQLINNTSYKSGTNNGKRYVTVHMTDNWRNGANAQAHANLQSNGNSRGAAWHWQVDDKNAYQSFNHKFQLWAAGDGRGNGNMNSIHVEICVNKDGNYKKSVVNGAKLVKKIIKDEGIPQSNVVQHNRWSGKNCPSDLRRGRDGITWSTFNSWIKGSSVAVVNKKPSKKAINKQYSGDSIIDFLDIANIDSSRGNRKKLAGQYGIKNYTGTAKQNLSLLNKLRKGKPSKVKPSTAKSSKSSSVSNIKVGSKVKINSSASKYSRSRSSIPSRFKGKSYTVQQVGKNDVLIKELYSWVRKSDLAGGKATVSKPTSKIKVGNTVTLKKSAVKFATGQSILNSVKGKKYKILQVKKDRVLLDKIVSWVKRSDIS